MQIDTEDTETIMAVAMVVAGGALIGVSTLMNTLVDKLVPSNDGSNFGEEMLNDSTIEDSSLTLKMEVLH